ncbi:hypothetical protein A3H77_02125 [Candidatus Kaiserbacteria bacterium RIFCSPLOWO2_02_FULL_56_11]|uniref:Small ribosomal subunit protein bS20 n=2 Tax=Candidatus Kaiseribacteriota TaxID=1752734 RepID=A0A1F6E3X3_9BACT|nr:MAG: hypothetical protein A3C95_00240 [Candidatus Kaiserbacteria bacterium RIFCSPHIGHO2_02_FULL_56_30]OGG72238.1 MAG: hypothetical protein A3E65_01970 [Candidatus Kaiserbacteria bacterium RIFCSPHIGHO2_12_FULL_56_13]OGG82238.1 MAG: hypothetical protein A3H77_02125 [Candidatus Kaiserbacteria bacterium RIFCSPLOWO2_02_FULL_56_11]
MAVTKSAKKAARAALRRRVFNLRRKKTLQEAVKAVEKAGSKADRALLAAAHKAIDKAAKVNVISKNAAAHKKSRLAKLTRSS